MWPCSQAESGYSDASIAASAMRSIAALEASGSDVWSSCPSSARSRCDVGVGCVPADWRGGGLGPRILFGFFEQCDER